MSTPTGASPPASTSMSGEHPTVNTDEEGAKDSPSSEQLQAIVSTYRDLGRLLNQNSLVNEGSGCSGSHNDDVIDADSLLDIDDPLLHYSTGTI